MPLSIFHRGRLPAQVCSLILGVGVFPTSMAAGWGDEAATPGVPKARPSKMMKWFGHRDPTMYAPPASTTPVPQPGVQGFRLKYHPGYGYGGDSLGVTPNGGYPTYGGPGYPHPGPRLQRLGGINPFPFFGGPGGPSPTCPHFYGEPGSLVPDSPVVTLDPNPYQDHYGAFTGTLPYPETTFAPFSSAGETASPAPRSTTLPSPPPATPPGT